MKPLKNSYFGVFTFYPLIEDKQRQYCIALSKLQIGVNEKNVLKKQFNKLKNEIIQLKKKMDIKK